jgi:hypothetical protein
MYKELKGNDEPRTVIEKVAPKRQNNFTANYNKYNLPVADYLAKLDTNKFLFSDRIVWLRVLSACKNTNDVNAFDSCYNWSKQGKYLKMTLIEFSKQWNSACGVNNGYAWLHANTKR